MSSAIRAGIRSSYGRSPSWFEPLCPYYYYYYYYHHYQGPYRVAVVLGRGKLAKIEVALSNRLVELGGYQGKLLGEQLARMVPCDLEIRAAKFVSRRSGFQIKQQMLQWGSTRCGQGRGR
jgi:hypothetical protein